MRAPVRGSIITAVAQPEIETGGTLRTSWPRAFSSSMTSAAHACLDIEPVQLDAVRPERAEEVKRLHPRQLERRVQVRIPLVAGTRRRSGTPGGSSAPGCRRPACRSRGTARRRAARCWASACSAAASAAAAARRASCRARTARRASTAPTPVLPAITPPRDPAAARRRVEHVAVLVDDRDVRRVLQARIVGVRRQLAAGGVGRGPRSRTATP